jgi:hypothetical protein
VDVRPAVAADLPLIQRMLYEAANCRGEDWGEDISWRRSVMDNANYASLVPWTSPASA